MAAQYVQVRFQAPSPAAAKRHSAKAMAKKMPDPRLG